MIPDLDIFGISIPLYMLTISGVFSFCLLWIQSRAHWLDLEPRWTMELCILVMIAGFLGARVLHIFYEAPHLYIENPGLAFEVWRGGFVYLGGFVTGFAAALCYLAYRKESLDRWMILFAPVLPLAYGLGRFACYFQGCCYGEACDLPWGAEFPSHETWGMEVIKRHPTQLYAVLSSVGVFGLIWGLEKKIEMKDLSFRSLLLPLFLIFHGLNRIWIEQFRADDRGEMLWGLSLSTWISIGLIGLGFGFAYWVRAKLKD